MTTHISILRIPGFPSADLPEGLTPEWIGEALAPACTVRYISLAALKAGLVPGKSDLGPGGGTDLLILPYGNAFPVEGLDGLRRFVGWGGNVMTTGGLGFGRLLQAAGTAGRQSPATTPAGRPWPPWASSITNRASRPAVARRTRASSRNSRTPGRPRTPVPASPSTPATAGTTAVRRPAMCFRSATRCARAFPWSAAPIASVKF